MEGYCPGSPVFSRVTPGVSPEFRDNLDTAVADVAKSAQRWASLTINERLIILDQLLNDTSRLAEEWLEATAHGKGVSDNPDAVAQEWISGPYVTIRYLRRLRNSLHQLKTKGTIRLPGVYNRITDGRTVVRALPQDIFDRLFFTGVSSEVIMAPGIPQNNIQSYVARTYLRDNPPSGTTLVLGAGNVSGMGPIDSLYELFIGNHTVLLKMSPVNNYMTGVIERSFRSLLEIGFLRIVQGGYNEGSYLCDHSGIDCIRLTGSDKTYEAVVYGSDSLSSERKTKGMPYRSKPVNAELGGVGPTIVLPGHWKQSEIIRGAELVATMAFDGGGFSCGATDLVLLPESWMQKDAFIGALRQVLSQMPLRPAYYPGTNERFSTFVSMHDKVELFGKPEEGQLPWAFIRNLDMNNSKEICFTREPFCGVFADLTIPADTLESYLDRAVRFINERVWGTLGATLLVPSSVAKDHKTAGLVEKSIADLRYGTIAVNYHPSAGWVSGVTPWGGYQNPGINPSESGVGFSQNAMMLSDTEKTVIRAPLGGPLPPPVWFTGRGKAACKTFSLLCRFEGNPSFTKVPGILKSGSGL